MTSSASGTAFRTVCLTVSSTRRVSDGKVANHPSTLLKSVLAVPFAARARRRLVVRALLAVMAIVGLEPMAHLVSAVSPDLVISQAVRRRRQRRRTLHARFHRTVQPRDDGGVAERIAFTHGPPKRGVATVDRNQSTGSVGRAQ